MTDTTPFDFDAKITAYLEKRKRISEIERRVKLYVKDIKEEMLALEAEITNAADAAGLKNVPGKHGTAYWTTHHSCTAGNASALMDYVIANSAWGLIEKRPSKTGVLSHITAYGEPPPGVNFRSYRAFNIREVPND
jgi:hypothetical protein